MNTPDQIRHRTIPAINFILYRTTTTIDQLYKLLPVGQQVIREAVRRGLTITGPLHWHYHGFTGDPQASFTLEVALPVAEAFDEIDEIFHCKKAGPFQCITLMHDGPWDQLPATYGRLISYAEAQGITLSGTNREVYINANFTTPESNITEVQLGIR